MRRRPGVGGFTGGWWLMSLMLHAGAAIAVMWCTPLREMIFKPPQVKEQVEVTLEGARLRKVMERIRHINEEKLRDRIEDLNETRHEMEMIAEKKTDQFDLFKEGQRLLEAEDIQSSMTEAIEAQDRALHAEEKALNAQEHARKDLSDGKMADALAQADMARNAQSEAQIAQGEIAEAQKETTQAIKDVDFIKNARAAQQEAETAQQNANRAQTEADKAQREGKRLQEDVRKAFEEAQKARNELAAAVKADEEARKQLKEAGEEAKKTERTATEANTRSQAATADLRQAERERLQAEGADEQTVAKASDRLERTKAEEKKTDEEAKKTQNEADLRRIGAVKAKEFVVKSSEQLAQAKNDETNTRSHAEQIQRMAEIAQDKAREEQVNARQTQTEARKKQAAVIDALDMDIAVYKKQIEEAAIAKKDTGPEEMAGLEQMKVGELYDEASAMEDDIAGIYKEIRAAELAMIQNMSLEMALEATAVARPVRPDLDTGILERTSYTSSDVLDHNAKLETVVNEVESIVELTGTMMALARALDKSEAQGATLSLDWMLEKTKHYHKMKANAVQETGSKSSDLSQLMRKFRQGAKGGTASDKEGEDMDKLNEGWAEVKETPPPDARDIRTTEAIPGRKIMASGIPAKYMYVDSWYTIGPFPNPERKNIDTKFPPETVVDLDATYVGKDGKTVKWEFLQAGQPKAVPAHDEEYAIYYAYTEVWVENAMDLWIAVGCDDKAKVWIEDQLVWVSSNRQKPWNIDEAFRKVHFEQGLNRILYRVENGWRDTVFSLVLTVQPKG